MSDEEWFTDHRSVPGALMSICKYKVSFIGNSPELMELEKGEDYCVRFSVNPTAGWVTIELCESTAEGALKMNWTDTASHWAVHSEKLADYLKEKVPGCNGENDLPHRMKMTPDSDSEDNRYLAWFQEEKT